MKTKTKMMKSLKQSWSSRSKDVTVKLATELQSIAAKLGRAEDELQALKNEMAELRAVVAAGAAAAPAAVPEQAVTSPVQEAVTPPAKKSRPQRAADKRTAVSEPSEPAEPVEVSEPPETAGTSRRVQRKTKNGRSDCPCR